MNIQIDENTRITSDTHNIIIEERKVAGDKAENPGVERWVQASFHYSIDQALEWLFNRDIRMSDAQELTELLKDARASFHRLRTAMVGKA